VDGQTVEAAKRSFDGWIEPMLQSIHRQGYRAPDIRRVYIPKPGKTEKRPLGVPTVADRALQRSTAEVLSAIYEQDFLPCSFGGRQSSALIMPWRPSMRSSLVARLSGCWRRI
jgi:retron-type reverse transcriptase